MNRAILAAFALIGGCAPAARPVSEITAVRRVADRATFMTAGEELPGAHDEASISFRPVPLLRDVAGVAQPIMARVELKWHDYSILACSGRPGAPWYGPYWKGDDLPAVDAIVILRGGKEVFTLQDSSDWIDLGGQYGLPANAVTDLDANGRPEVIIQQQTSGVHSHVTFTWCELEPEFRVAYVLDGPADTVRFAQLDDTPALEFVTADREFDAWRCGADYEHIPVPLRCVDGSWEAEVDLMGRTAGDFACPGTADYYLPGSKSSDAEEACSGMRYVLLEYIAAGHEAEGWALVKSWTAISEAEKARFVKTMRRGLKRSKIWKLVRAGWKRRGRR